MRGQNIQSRKNFRDRDCFIKFKCDSATINNHPLFLGPVFIHGKSNYKTFLDFFSTLSFKFHCQSYDRLIVGSDDEQALHQALEKAFPGCQLVLCTRHLKQNMQRYMPSKVGATSKLVSTITNATFGLLEAADDIEFKRKKQDLLLLCKQDCPDLVNYLTWRFLPALTAKVWDKRQCVLVEWSNNNAESYNHVLKRLTDWKQLALPKLVSLIRNGVAAQYKDIEKAIVNLEPFKLANPYYEKFKLTYSQWCAKSKTEKEHHMKSCMKYAFASGNKTACTSSNNKLVTFLPSSACGKKPGQQKRKRAEKSFSTIKVPRKDEADLKYL